MSLVELITFSVVDLHPLQPDKHLRVTEIPPTLGFNSQVPTLDLISLGNSLLLLTSWVLEPLKGTE